ncbi:CU044_5270 family protein [Dactylosporangium darangshiense]|uniref:CU044_5270 family protein n=1 Tax=Dactylosporangium darangshiense TaxID=579108 RepID=A0ABP8DJE3_9ACTN
MTKRDVLRTLAEARPHRLDPSRVPPLPDLPALQALARPRARRPRGLALGAATAAVAAAGVALAVLTTGGENPTQPVPPPPVAGSSAAPIGNLLLLAAERALAEPPATGRYWRTQTETGETRHLAAYDVTIRMAMDDWRAAAGGGVSVGRYLGADPVDEAAWRAAGAPTSWRDGDVTIEKAPGGQFTRALPANAGFMLAGRPVTAADLAGLPTEAGALRGELVRRYGEKSLFDAAEQLVLDLPAPPAVRAAAFRVLAGIDGVAVAGPATDRSGRTGTAVVYRRQGDAGWSETRLIIDPQTGRALAEESWHEGKMLGYTLVVSAGWTDENPPAK